MHVPREKSSSKILFYKNESSWAVLMPQLHCQTGDSDHRRHHCQHPFYTDLKNNTAFTQLTMWTRRNRSINQHHKQTDRKMIATDEGHFIKISLSIPLLLCDPTFLVRPSHLPWHMCLWASWPQMTELLTSWARSKKKCHIQNPSVKNYMYCKFNNEGVSILKQMFNFLVAMKNENELQLPYFFRISSCFFCLSSRLQTEMEQWLIHFSKL